MSDAAIDDETASALLPGVSRIITAVWRDIDSNGGRGVSSWFTPSGRIRIQDHEVLGRAAIDAMYAGRRARGARTSRHLVSNLYLVSIAGDTVTCQSTMTLYAADGTPPLPVANPLMIADEIDVLVRVDRRWLIESRQVTGLFVASDAVFGIPLEK